MSGNDCNRSDFKNNWGVTVIIKLTYVMLALCASITGTNAQFVPMYEPPLQSSPYLFDMDVAPDGSVWAVGSFPPNGPCALRIVDGTTTVYSIDAFPGAMQGKVLGRIVVSPTNSRIAYVVNSGGIAELLDGSIRDVTPRLNDTLPRTFVDMALDASGNTWYISEATVLQDFDGQLLPAKETEVIRDDGTSLRVWSGNQYSSYPQTLDSLYASIRIPRGIVTLGNDIYVFGYGGATNPFAKQSFRIDASDVNNFGGLIRLVDGEMLDIFTYNSSPIFSSARLSVASPDQPTVVENSVYLGFDADPGKGIAPLLRVTGDKIDLINPRQLQGFTPLEFGNFSSTTYAPWPDNENHFVVGGSAGLHKVTPTTIERLPNARATSVLGPEFAFNPSIKVLRFTTQGLVVGYYTEGIYLIPWSVLSVKHTSDSHADRGGTVVEARAQAGGGNRERGLGSVAR